MTETSGERGFDSQSLIDKAAEKFWNTNIVINQYGRFEAYGPYHAVSELIAEMNMSESETLNLLVSLIRQSPVTPRALDFSIIGDMVKDEEVEDIWAIFCKAVANEIIVSALFQIPEIDNEWARRKQEESNLEYPEL